MTYIKRLPVNVKTKYKKNSKHDKHKEITS